MAWESSEGFLRRSHSKGISWHSSATPLSTTAPPPLPSTEHERIHSVYKDLQRVDDALSSIRAQEERVQGNSLWIDSHEPTEQRKSRLLSRRESLLLRLPLTRFLCDQRCATDWRRPQASRRLQHYLQRYYRSFPQQQFSQETLLTLNEIALISMSGQVLSIVDGNGRKSLSIACVAPVSSTGRSGSPYWLQRESPFHFPLPLSLNESKDSKSVRYTRQFQQATFSPSHSLLAVCEMYFDTMSTLIPPLTSLPVTSATANTVAASSLSGREGRESERVAKLCGSRVLVYQIPHIRHDDSETAVQRAIRSRRRGQDKDEEGPRARLLMDSGPFLASETPMALQFTPDEDGLLITVRHCVEDKKKTDRLVYLPLRTPRARLDKQRAEQERWPLLALTTRAQLLREQLLQDDHFFRHWRNVHTREWMSDLNGRKYLSMLPQSLDSSLPPIFAIQVTDFNESTGLVDQTIYQSLPLDVIPLPGAERNMDSDDDDDDDDDDSETDDRSQIKSQSRRAEGAEITDMSSVNIDGLQENVHFQWHAIHRQQVTRNASAVWSKIHLCHALPGAEDCLVFMNDSHLCARRIVRTTAEEVANGPSITTLWKSLFSAKDVVVERVYFQIAADATSIAVLERCLVSSNDTTSSLPPSSVSHLSLILRPFGDLSQKKCVSISASALAKGRNVYMTSESPNKMTSSKINEVIAMWYSPDGQKLLCLLRHRSRNVEERGDYRWVVLDVPSGDSYAMDTFQPTNYFLRAYLPNFDRHAETFNPWAPDSTRFLYCDDQGLHCIPLPTNNVRNDSLLSPVDKWIAPHVTFATWTKF